MSDLKSAICLIINQDEELDNKLSLLTEISISLNCDEVLKLCEEIRDELLPDNKSEQVEDKKRSVESNRNRWDYL